MSRSIVGCGQCHLMLNWLCAGWGVCSKGMLFESGEPLLAVRGLSAVEGSFGSLALTQRCGMKKASTSPRYTSILPYIIYWSHVSPKKRSPTQLPNFELWFMCVLTAECSRGRPWPAHRLLLRGVCRHSWLQLCSHECFAEDCRDRGPTAMCGIEAQFCFRLVQSSDW